MTWKRLNSSDGYLYFILVPASYAAAVEPTTESSSPCIVKGSKDLLCPFLAQGHCPYDEECEYLHGNICDMCGLAVLHPENKSQREEHQKVCCLVIVIFDTQLIVLKLDKCLFLGP